ncbi:VOC family protein [Streptomyces abyssomicinicus]|uniref:VOC family protein n=1 Tax=Streptomyces abyssomicinicus TaxID=574929 RepID=UPI00124FF8CA|nr:VOC family protein [Streptomyces abyssomicinicus]
MTNSSVQIKAVIVDAADPERLAGFWAGVLGRQVAGRTGPYVWLDREADLVVGFQQTSEPRPPGKNRVHLDVSCPDPVTEQRRIEGLGGRRLHAYDDGGFLVMADPEGNEFCVIPDGPDGSVGLDERGRAHYLDHRPDRRADRKDHH